METGLELSLKIQQIRKFAILCGSTTNVPKIVCTFQAKHPPANKPLDKYFAESLHPISALVKLQGKFRVNIALMRCVS